MQIQVHVIPVHLRRGYKPHPLHRFFSASDFTAASNPFKSFFEGFISLFQGLNFGLLLVELLVQDLDGGQGHAVGINGGDVRLTSVAVMDGVLACARCSRHHEAR